MMLVQILSVLAVCLRVVIGLILVESIVCEKKSDKRGRISSIISGIVGGVAIGFGALYIDANDLVRIVAEVVVITLLIAMSYRIGYRKCLFIAIFYEMALGLGQFLVGAGIAIATLDKSYMDAATLLGQIAVWVMIAVAIIVSVMTVRRMQIKAALKYIVLVLFFGVITISSQNRLEIPQDDVFMWTILAACFVGGLLIFNMSKQMETEKKLAQMKAEQAELLEKDYTELNNAYATNAKLFHDFHNHIGMIRQLVSDEKYSDAIDYLDELQAPVKDFTDSKWTGDNTIDYLINTKVAGANESKIDMQIQVEYPRHANLKSADMCAIIGNLLDNALEAARKVPDEDKRFIRLTIRRINQMLVIKVENSYETELRAIDGQLQTTKTEGGIHGWGIKSVRAAVEKYEGTVQIAQEEQVFKVVATLSFDGVE